MELRALFQMCKFYQHISRIQFSSVKLLSHVRLFVTPWTVLHTKLPCSSPTPRAYSNSCPLSQWCHPTISTSVIPFFSHLQSFPASGSFKMSQLFALGGQSIGVSDSASVLPKNIQGWFPLGWASWISLLSVFYWLMASTEHLRFKGWGNKGYLLMGKVTDTLHRSRVQRRVRLTIFIVNLPY